MMTRFGSLRWVVLLLLVHGLMTMACVTPTAFNHGSVAYPTATPRPYGRTRLPPPPVMLEGTEFPMGATVTVPPIRVQVDLSYQTDGVAVFTMTWTNEVTPTTPLPVAPYLLAVTEILDHGDVVTGTWGVTQQALLDTALPEFPTRINPGETDIRVPIRIPDDTEVLAASFPLAYDGELFLVSWRSDMALEPPDPTDDAVAIEEALAEIWSYADVWDSLEDTRMAEDIRDEVDVHLDAWDALGSADDAEVTDFRAQVEERRDDHLTFLTHAVDALQSLIERRIAAFQTLSSDMQIMGDPHLARHIEQEADDFADTLTTAPSATLSALRDQVSDRLAYWEPQVQTRRTTFVAQMTAFLDDMRSMITEIHAMADDLYDYDAATEGSAARTAANTLTHRVAAIDSSDLAALAQVPDLLQQVRDRHAQVQHQVEAAEEDFTRNHAGRQEILDGLAALSWMASELDRYDQSSQATTVQAEHDAFESALQVARPPDLPALLLQVEAKVDERANGWVRTARLDLKDEIAHLIRDLTNEIARVRPRDASAATWLETQVTQFTTDLHDFGTADDLRDLRRDVQNRLTYARDL